MSFFVAPPEPPTKLGRHRQLAPLAGVHISPICLGAMSIGDRWDIVGRSDRENSFKLLDAFYEAGGNFIDTANFYQDETSAMYIGEWLEKRGVRDQIVLATKYTSCYKSGNLARKTAYIGNNIKSLHLSVEAPHWEWSCSVEEVMNGLHNLVVQDKVLYLGVSDTPAWIVAKANTYARMAGKTPFAVYQGAWSILQRDFEREIIPMARAEGMALAPWGVLAAGKIRTDEEEQRRRESGEQGRAGSISPGWERTEDQRKVCLALEKVAAEIGARSIQAVAIAYVMQKTPYVFPIIGGRKVEQLMDTISALTPEQIKELEGVLPFNPGFSAQ